MDDEYNLKLQQHLDEFIATVGLTKSLMDDVIDYLAEGDKDSQIWRRTFFRVVFAAFEGIIYSTKHRTLLISKITETDLPIGQTVLLSETAFDLDDNGTIREMKAKIPFKKNLRFAFRTPPAVAGKSFTADYSGEDWRAMTESVKVRDRLTHPKHDTDLTVSDEEYRTLSLAVRWFLAATQELLIIQQQALNEFEQSSR